MSKENSATPRPSFYELSFSSKLWKWAGKDGSDKGSWYFFTVPKSISQKIRLLTSGKPRKGFGSVPVLVTIGRTRWRTSVFPETKDGQYILPVKSAVRKAENIVEGQKVNVIIELVGIVK